MGILPRFFLVVLLVLFGVSDLSMAAAEWTIRPELSLRGRYDSDFTAIGVNADEEEYSYVAAPGISAELNTAITRIAARYKASISEYPGNLDYVGHAANLQASYDATSRMTFSVEDEFFNTRTQNLLEETLRKVRNPWLYSEFGGLEDKDMREYWVNYLSPGISYQFHRKFEAKLRYRNTTLVYVDPGTDSVEHRGILDLVYYVSPHSYADLQYAAWQRYYDPVGVSDYTVHQGFLTLSKQFYYLTMEVGGGYQHRTFDTKGLDDYGEPLYLVEFMVQNPPAPSEPYSYLRVGARSYLNESGTNGGYYYGHKFYLHGGYVFRDRLYLNAWTSFGTEDYYENTGPLGTPAGREDEQFDASARIGYKIFEWAILSVAGGFENHVSNLVGPDWSNTFAIVQLDIAQEFGNGRL